ncbi:N-acetylglucosaminidase [Bacillus swezeyi]|uniref:N-acetylglucosaminidase n=1 Tax=Bacillus swezeyi TaxID=1925020 RepID=UPI002E1C33F6|nr:N-acetylglucosaminidase [Bacillus swezeyi]MED2941907.1 N-acetylglucosaminidase [Bacillus swezeyi]MED3071699.1 N-acetylglucosaminidase [Bacillus swezeyi]MED3080661.1 N-acetylglucosaminidase [Bacillus swezeyi]
MKRKAFIFTLASFLILLAAFPNFALAYTDYSTYNLETKEQFSGSKEVQTSIEKLKNDFGWNATAKKGASYENYQIISGGFSSEARVKSSLEDLKKNTGISASYQPMGNAVDYQRIITSAFTGEARIKNVLEMYEQKTGQKASYEPTGTAKSYQRIVTSAFTGEARIKNVLEMYEQETGQKASYEPTGTAKSYQRIVTSAFTGEARIKNVLEMYEQETGQKASYEPTGTAKSYQRIVTSAFTGETRVKNILEMYEQETGQKASYEPAGTAKSYQRIVTSAFTGEARVKNVLKDFQEKTGLEASYELVGEKEDSKYRIVTQPILDESKLNTGLKYFHDNNWGATAQKTGETGYEKYRIVTNPTLDASEIKAGLKFFTDHNWGATAQKTGETGYEKYRIVTNPTLDASEIKAGLKFFTDHGWGATAQKTGETGYNRYQIVTASNLSINEYKKARDFFIEKEWSFTYKKTNDYYYKIIIGEFTGYDNASSSASKIKSKYGWDVSINKVLNGPQIMYTDYGLTLAEMLKKQMSVNPQTDSPGYVSLTYINTANSTVTADYLNVRSSPKVANNNIVGLLQKGDKVSMTGTDGNWAKINMGWRNASEDETGYYINPNNFSMDSKYYFQFLKLSQYAGLSASEINSKILKGKGILEGKGAAFVEASKKYNINELYLISHALLETGNGTSQLAKGVKYNGKTVYNMYGYGAYDSCPLECGSKTAYEQGWDTPEKAIIGGAELIGKNYIHRSGFQQDTLFKMRWAPTASHQYATDIGWAYKQVSRMYSLYTLLDNYTLYYDIPKYK